MRTRLWLGLGVAAVAAVAAMSASGGSGGGTITTIAGTGNGSFSGDGGPAASAELWGPSGVAVDAKGNVYIADAGNNRVRKVDARGTIRTIAGTGRAGFSGDGGPGRAARLNSPSAVAVDKQGNVYIADTYNLRVRRVSGRGIITTIAGTGKYGPSGNGGPATKAPLYVPVGVAVDAQRTLYVYEVEHDRGIGRVRKVDRGGTITAFAGGKSGFSGDGGPATSAQLSHLGGVAVDTKGNVYIADYGNQRVRKVDIRGTITTIAGTGAYGFSGDGGPATRARLYNPYGVATDGQGNVYIADFLNSRVRKVSRGGTITTIAGTGREGFSGDGGQATSARLFQPEGVAADRNGNVYVADHHNHRVRKISAGPAGATSRRVSSVSGRCSEAAARRIVTQLRLGDPFVADPFGKVLCGAFTGPGSESMVVMLRGDGNTGFVNWVVFRWAGGAWQFLMKQSAGASITAAGSDIRQTLPIYRAADARCCPSGGTKTRLWHWNGARFVARPWKQATPGEPAARGFDSPSLNISCGMFDDSSFRQVVCQSRTPPQKVTMDAAGRVNICRDRTPNDINNDCNLGDRGEGPIRPLAYGRQITVGRFRCLSLQIGVRCTVIQSGKGFLINRDGVGRVGP